MSYCVPWRALVRSSRETTGFVLRTPLAGGCCGQYQIVRASTRRLESTRITGRREDEMVQVQLEVRAGATRFRVSARAASIRRAVSVAGARYPGSEVRLVLPVEPETFFAGATPGERESSAVRMPASAAG